jgi:hypothetical protein
VAIDAEILNILVNHKYMYEYQLQTWRHCESLKLYSTSFTYVAAYLYLINTSFIKQNKGTHKIVVALQHKSGPDRLMVDVSRSQTIRHTHTQPVGLL